MMFILTLCNFRVPFGKLFLKKFAKFFRELAQNMANVTITATDKFGGEVAL